MNQLPARVISQRLSEGDRAAAFIPELRSRDTLGRPRSERELREWQALIDLFLSGAVVPRKVFLEVDELELYDPVDGDWSQAFRSPGIRECELKGSPGQEKGDEWAIRLVLSLAKSSVRKLVLTRFLTNGLFVVFSQALRFNKTLQHLEIDLDRVTDAAWLSSILQNNPTLHTLIIHIRDGSRSVLETLAASLPTNTTLRHLGLRHFLFDYSSRTNTEVLFFNALGRNRGLHSFSLRGYFVYSRARDSHQALAGALASNPTLVDVDLDFSSSVELEILVERGLLVKKDIVGLKLSNWGPSDGCHQLLARVLSEKPIRRLQIYDVCLGVPFLPTLTMNSLAELKIYRAKGETTWRALADVVKRSAALRNLRVIFDDVERPTALLAMLAEALAVNQGLRKLFVAHRTASVATDTSLVRAIAKHPSLEEFDVEWIDCTVELAEIVKTHPSLTTIGCPVASVEHAQALIAAAKANRRLLKVKYYLSWDSCAERDECLHVLHSYLEMNRHGRHKLLIEHPFLLADLMGSLIDFRTRINLVMENPEALIQAIQDRRDHVLPQHP